jgi:hypothetical protein
LTVEDHPPIARLVKATVLFDTTVPRYFAAINECGVLRLAFPRALITTGVLLELQQARRPVAEAGGNLGLLLDDPAWAEVVQLTGQQILEVEQLRLAFHTPEELLAKATTDLGEFETIVAAQGPRRSADRDGGRTRGPCGSRPRPGLLSVHPRLHDRGDSECARTDGILGALWPPAGCGTTAAERRPRLFHR